MEWKDWKFVYGIIRLVIFRFAVCHSRFDGSEGAEKPALLRSAC